MWKEVEEGEQEEVEKKEEGEGRDVGESVEGGGGGRREGGGGRRWKRKRKRKEGKNVWKEVKEGEVEVVTKEE